MTDKPNPIKTENLSINNTNSITEVVKIGGLEIASCELRADTLVSLALGLLQNPIALQVLGLRSSDDIHKLGVG